MALGLQCKGTLKGAPSYGKYPRRHLPRLGRITTLVIFHNWSPRSSVLTINSSIDGFADGEKSLFNAEFKLWLTVSRNQFLPTVVQGGGCSKGYHEPTEYICFVEF